jgi:hypothetical protein
VAFVTWPFGTLLEAREIDISKLKPEQDAAAEIQAANSTGE